MGAADACSFDSIIAAQVNKKQTNKQTNKNGRRALLDSVDVYTHAPYRRTRTD